MLAAEAATPSAGTGQLILAAVLGIAAVVVLIASAYYFRRMEHTFADQV